MAEVEEVEDEDHELGPSLAFPPLYVVRAAERCPECGTAMYVYTLGCAAYRDAEDGYTIEQFHILYYINRVPEDVLKLLTAKCPSYYMNAPEEAAPPYLTNHCRCGAKLDDEFLHCDVGAAFWPDTPEGYGDFKLFLLPIDEPIPVESSFTLGGGEYLNLDQAEAW
jgi:hypothetical protein